MNRGFRLGQIVSGGLLALSHGTNDAQKTMGIITLALIANGNIAADDFHVPTWVVISAATAIALGTYAGGWRIIRTLGTRIIKMDPAQGFAAQSAGATVILASSHFGYPLSTTHTISGAVMGAGAAKRLSAVRWGVAGNIVTAWVLTIPAAGAIGALAYGVTRIFGTGALGPDRRVGARGRPDRRDLRAPRSATMRPPPLPAAGRVGAVILATVVDWEALLDVVVASLVAGVGVTITFSLAIYGATRFAEVRRDGPRGGASATRCSRSSGWRSPRRRGRLRPRRDAVQVAAPAPRIAVVEPNDSATSRSSPLVALAVAFLPGGNDTAELALAILSLAFLAAIGFLGYRLYMENKFTLWSMSDRHRAQLYAGFTVAFMTLTATDRLLGSGHRDGALARAAGRLGARRLQRLGRIPALQHLARAGRACAACRVPSGRIWPCRAW